MTARARAERAIGGILALFGAILAAEVAASWAYSTASGASWPRAFSILAFVTGLAALVVAGIGAAPGRLALGNQRLDRTYWAAPIQDPVLMGTLSTKAEARGTGEPGAAGIFLTFGLGVALILVAATLELV